LYVLIRRLAVCRVSRKLMGEIGVGDELKKPQLCEDQSRPACCYTIVSGPFRRYMDRQRMLTRAGIPIGPGVYLHFARYLPGCGRCLNR
jgi:hypothetical protein